MKKESIILLSDVSVEDKDKLKLLGCSYVVTLKGWVCTNEQYDNFTKGNIPQPTVDITNPKIHIKEETLEWRVSGDTFTKKDKIKSIGGKWEHTSKSWLIPITAITYDKLVVLLE